MTILPLNERHQPYRGYGAYGSVLVLNAGSSSLKYQVVNPSGGEPIASGIIERVGQDNATIKHSTGATTTKREQPIADHGEALRVTLALFAELGPDINDSNIVAVGHRVVHGGAIFTAPTLIDDAVVQQIMDLSPLAPLHNPANVRGIQVARELFPDIPHVAVFDTAFFAQLPEAAATYAVNAEVASAHGIRRYGFHGTSHEYVSAEVARLLGRDIADVNTIVLHLGNGASASAVRGGVPVDTSMGLTPLEGLVMGTRSGDVDPAVVVHLHRNAGLSVDDIDEVLNKKSGLKGLAGVSDFRELHDLVAEGDPAAQLALEVYIHRLKKYIGAYHAILGRVDVIAFTAGAGENDDIVRAMALRGLEPMGIHFDEALNEGRKSEPVVLSTAASRVVVLVVPTAEELTIARHCVDVIAASGSSETPSR